MGQNESVASSSSSSRDQPRKNDSSRQQSQSQTQSQQQRSSSPSSASTATSITTTSNKAPLSLIKESPSPSPPTFLATIAHQHQFAEDDIESQQLANDASWAASTSSSTSSAKRSSLGLGSSSRTKHLVFDDGIEVSFEDNEQESPPMTTKYNPIDISSLSSFKLDLSSSSSSTRTTQSGLSSSSSSSSKTPESSLAQSSELVEDGCIVHIIKKNDTLQVCLFIKIVWYCIRVF